MTEPDESARPEPDHRLPHEGPLRRGLWIVAAVLALTSLLLVSRNQLPAAPVLVMVIVALGAGLWWLADRGGRMGGRPVAAPVEALILLTAVLAAVAVFWIVFGWLE